MVLRMFRFPIPRLPPKLRVAVRRPDRRHLRGAATEKVRVWGLCLTVSITYVRPPFLMIAMAWVANIFASPWALIVDRRRTSFFKIEAGGDV